MPIGQELHEFVHAAWRGETITHPKIHRVTKLDKIILVTHNAMYPTNFQIVAFPKPEHSEAFERAGRGVTPWGPAKYNQGSVGLLRLSSTDNRGIILTQAQASFKRGSGERFLPAKLARYYGRWRREALKEAVKLAEEQKKILVVPRGVIRRKGRKLLRTEIERAAYEAGATVKKGLFSISITPRGVKPQSLMEKVKTAAGIFLSI